MTESEEKKVINSFARFQNTKHCFIRVEKVKELGNGQREVTFSQRVVKKGALMLKFMVLQVWVWVAKESSSKRKSPVNNGA